MGAMFLAHFSNTVSFSFLVSDSICLLIYEWGMLAPGQGFTSHIATGNWRIVDSNLVLCIWSWSHTFLR